MQAVIEARLGQLSAPASELAGVAATIGREFSADRCSRARANVGERRFVARPGRAVAAAHRRATHEPDAYDFSHGRIREVAYRALGPAQRRRHHLRVARRSSARTRTDPAP